MSSCLAYAVRSWVGETSFFTEMSGYLSVTRLIAASHTCADRFGVSKTRKVICFLPLAVPPPEPSFTEHPVIAARAISPADAKATILFT